MMGAAAVVIVAVCTIVYTVVQIAERRKRREFKKHLHRYAWGQKKRQGDDTDADV